MPEPTECWICGIEPLGWVETTVLSSPLFTRLPRRWPVTDRIDHEHALRPPRPSELEDLGRRALAKIHKIASETS